MHELHDLKTEITELKYCPVLVVGVIDSESALTGSVDAEDEAGGYLPCGARLEVVHIRTIRGDDYGDFPIDTVEFICGHTFKDMENSIKHRDQI